MSLPGALIIKGLGVVVFSSIPATVLVTLRTIISGLVCNTVLDVSPDGALLELVLGQVGLALLNTIDDKLHAILEVLGGLPSLLVEPLDVKVLLVSIVQDLEHNVDSASGVSNGILRVADGLDVSESEVVLSLPEPLVTLIFVNFANELDEAVGLDLEGSVEEAAVRLQIDLLGLDSLRPFLPAVLSADIDSGEGILVVDIISDLLNGARFLFDLNSLLFADLPDLGGVLKRRSVLLLFFGLLLVLVANNLDTTKSQDALVGLLNLDGLGFSALFAVELDPLAIVVLTLGPLSALDLLLSRGIDGIDLVANVSLLLLIGSADDSDLGDLLLIVQ